MAIVIAVLLAAALFGLQRYYFSKHWSQRFRVSLEIEKKGVCIGEVCELREVIRNEKRMPLPAVQIKFMADKSFAFEDEKNASITDHYYRNDLFCVGGKQQVTRCHTFRAGARGFFTIREIQAVAQDYFFSGLFAQNFANEAQLYVYPGKVSLKPFEQSYRQIMGEITARRNFQEDPFCFRGIRPYQPYDSMRKINWKCSAKNGELLVNTYDTSYSLEICILLNINTHAVWKRQEMQEYSISIVSALTQRFLSDGVAVSVYTNAADVETGEPIQIERGLGPQQMVAVDRGLARIDTAKPAGDFLELARRECRQEQNRVQYLLISSEHSGEWIDFYFDLRKKLPGVCQIVPETQEERWDVRDGMVAWNCL